MSDIAESSGERSWHEGAAERHRHAHAWWMVGELVRHHPELHFHFPRRGNLVQGLSGPLILSDPRTEDGRAVIFDFTGIHLHPEPLRFIEWADVLIAERPLDALRKIENGLGLTTVSKPPRSGSAALVYRSIAAVLGIVVNHRSEWNVVPVKLPLDPSDRAASWSLLSIAENVDRVYVASWKTTNDSLGWVLFRDNNPVALFDVSGRVVTDEASFDLLAVHHRTGRKLTVTVATVLGSVLP